MKKVILSAAIAALTLSGFTGTDATAATLTVGGSIFSAHGELSGSYPSHSRIASGSGGSVFIDHGRSFASLELISQPLTVSEIEVRPYAGGTLELLPANGWVSSAFVLTYGGGSAVQLIADSSVAPVFTPDSFSIELATPIPEPQVYSLTAVGLAVLGVVALRRRIMSNEHCPSTGSGRAVGDLAAL